MKLLTHLLPFLLLHLTQAFYFRQVVVTASTYIIRNTATYNFTLSRNVDNTFSQTNWSVTSVPQASNITIQFPSEYSHADIAQCSCSSITIGSNTITNPTVVVLGNTVVIMNTITTATFVQVVKLTLTNVLNPAPASKTSFFVGTIGDDVAEPISNAYVQLQMGSLASCSASFSQGMVNTYDNLIITISSLSVLDNTNLVYVTFPSTYQSSYSTQSIGVASTMTCVSLSSSGLSCVGNTPSSRVVTVYSAFASNGSQSTSFQINNILVPPTVQQIDTITIGTYTSAAVGYDRCTIPFSNINAIPLTSLTYSTASTAYVNTAVPLTLSIPLLTYLYNLDYILINFASSYSPIYQLISFSGIATGSVSVGFVINSNSATSLNLSTTVNLTSGTTLDITLSNIIGSPSSGISPVITISLYQVGYLKSSGSIAMRVYPNTLASLSISAGNPLVGSVSQYTVTFIPTNSIPASGMIRLLFPSAIGVTNTTLMQVTVNSRSVTFSILSGFNGLSLTNIPSISSNTTNIITITSLQNPLTTGTISSSFTLTTYYTTSTVDLVDSKDYVPSQLTFTGPQTIGYLVYSSSQYASATNVSLLFVVTSQLGLSNGGSISIILHEMPYFISNTSCLITTVNMSITFPCSISSNTTQHVVTISNITANIGKSFNVTVNKAFTNPASTYPQAYFTIVTYSQQATQTERSSSLSQPYLSITKPSTFIYFNLSKSSLMNSATATYIFTFQQPSIFSTADSDINQVSFTFPPEINISLATCTNCVVSNSTLLVTLDNLVIVNQSSASISISNVINPPSFQPLTQNITATTILNTFYTYSQATTLNNYWQTLNSIPSNLSLNSASFSSFTIGSQNSLSLDILPSSIVSYYILTLSPLFANNMISCSATSASTTCSYNFTSNTITIIKNSSSVNTVVSVTGLFNPPITANQSLTSVLQGYSSSKYLVNQYKGNQLIWSSSCNYPCQTCSTNKSVCLSCFSNTSISNYTLFYASQSVCLFVCYSTQLQVGSTCVDCTNNCMQCSGSTSNCTACNTSTSFAYFFNNTCLTVTSCPLQYYADITYTCLLCQFPCLTCVNASQCISCASGAFWYNGNCISTCPYSFTVANTINKTCDLCSPICSTCSISISNCTTCGAGTIKFNGSCYTNCSEATYVYIDHCVTSCVSPCVTCNVSAQYCLSCQTNGTQLFLYQGQCLNSCPSGFAINKTASLCDSCSALSINCSYCEANRNCSIFGGSVTCLSSQYYSCIKCDANITYYFNSLLGVYQCVTTLPDGLVSINFVAVPCDPICLTCANFTTSCKYCSSLKLFNGVCLSSCLSGFFAETISVSFNSVNVSTLICTLCVGNCLTCLSKTECLSCTNNTFYNGNFSCVNSSSCPLYTYANVSYANCTACNSPCLTCFSFSGCYSCQNNTFLYISSCLSSCPVGFFPESSNKTCMACTPPCSACASSATTCTACIASYYFYSYNNTCNQTCPIGFTINYSLQICQNCTLPCIECTDSQCFKCTVYNNISYVNFGMACIENCPQGYYPNNDPLNSTCIACNATCATCNDSSSCILCAVGYSLLSAGVCVDSCPSYQPVNKFVAGISVCLACSDTNCLVCSPLDKCQSCRNYSFVNLQGICKTTCPTGLTLVANITNNTATCENITIISNNTVSSFIQGETLQILINFPCSYLAAFFVFIAILIKIVQYCCLDNSKVLLYPLLSAALALPQIAATYLATFTYFLLRYKVFLRGPLDWDVFIILFAVCILIQLAIGFYTLIIETKIQWNDSVYSKWSRYSNCLQKSYQYSINLLTILNFKISHCLWCGIKSLPMLETSNKLIFYNRPSFISALVSLTLTTDCILIIIFHPQLSIIYFDIIIVLVVSLLFSLMALRRPYDFFIHRLDINPDLPLNKRVADSEGYLVSPMRPIQSYESPHKKQKSKSQLLNESISQRSSESFNPLSSQRSSIRLQNMSIQYSNPHSSQKFMSKENSLTLGNISVFANPGGVSCLENMMISKQKEQSKESQERSQNISENTNNLLDTNMALLDVGQEQSFTAQNDESIVGKEVLPKELRNNFFDVQRCKSDNRSVEQSEQFVYFSEHPSKDRSSSYSKESVEKESNQLQSNEISSYFKPQEAKKEEDSIVSNILPVSIANISIQSNQTDANFTQQQVLMPFEDIKSQQGSILSSLAKSNPREMSSVNNASFHSQEQPSLEEPVIQINMSKQANPNDSVREESVHKFVVLQPKDESYLAAATSFQCKASTLKKQPKVSINSSVYPQGKVSIQSSKKQEKFVGKKKENSEVAERNSLLLGQEMDFTSYQQSLANSRLQRHGSPQEKKEQSDEAQCNINVSADISVQNLNGSFASSESEEKPSKVNKINVLSISSFYHQGKSKELSNVTIKQSSYQPMILENKDKKTKEKKSYASRPVQKIITPSMQVNCEKEGQSERIIEVEARCKGHSNASVQEQYSDSIGVAYHPKNQGKQGKYTNKTLMSKVSKQKNKSQQANYDGSSMREQQFDFDKMQHQRQSFKSNISKLAEAEIAQSLSDNEVMNDSLHHRMKQSTHNPSIHQQNLQQKQTSRNKQKQQIIHNFKGKDSNPSIVAGSQINDDLSSYGHQSNIFNQSHLSNMISANNSLSSLANSHLSQRQSLHPEEMSNQSIKMRSSSKYYEGYHDYEYNNDIISEEVESVEISNQSQEQPLPSMNIQEPYQFRIRTTKKKKKREVKSKEKILYAEEHKFKTLKKEAEKIERQARINKKLENTIEEELNGSKRPHFSKSGSREKKESSSKIEKVYGQRPFHSKEKDK